MLSMVICKMFQSQVSAANVRGTGSQGTLLQNAVTESKAHFVRVLLEFGYVMIFLTMTEGTHLIEGLWPIVCVLIGGGS